MKKRLLIAALLLTACTQTAVVPTEPEPDRDFNFKFSYGYGLIPSELNTFNDTFTKDMIVDEPITVSMILSEEELKTIQEKIIESDLFTEPVQGDIRMVMAPCASYALEVDFGNTTNKVEWSCDNTLGGRATFVEFMWDFIEGKDEYQALPEPQGGYM
jgi:hypothetical protein